MGGIHRPSGRERQPWERKDPTDRRCVAYVRGLREAAAEHRRESRRLHRGAARWPWQFGSAPHVAETLRRRTNNGSPP